MSTELKSRVKHKAGVVVCREGEKGGIEVLLVSARKHKGSWVFPVGTVEDHETLQVTAARECEEESGYLVETEDEIGTVQVMDGKKSTFFTFYKARVTGEKEDYEKDRERKWVATELLEEKVADIFKPIAKNFIQSITQLNLNKIAVYINKLMKDLYSSIAHIYRSLRVTDSAAVLYIKDNLGDFDKIVAADVGAGAGRYAKLFFEHFGNDRLFLSCFDTNEFMLKSLTDYLKDNNYTNFITKIATAEEMPVDSGELDCIFSFNSIHHFHFYKFFDEAIRVLKPGGKIYIYSRTRKQNESSIWGKFFPLFSKKESRLFEPDEFEFKLGTIPGLELEEIKIFSFDRDNTIKELVDRASSRHYSAFFLYEQEEFDYALSKFKDNLEANYPDPESVKWLDEKILYIIKKS